MTYGSAPTAADVPAFMRSVRGGREPEPGLVEEFIRRYQRIGFSPLVRITQEQGEALQALLGDGFRVQVGMLHSEPTIAEGIRRLGDVSRVVAITLSPQWSPLIMGGYRRAVEAAAGDLEVSLVEAWHDVPQFLDALAARVKEALARYGNENLRVILTVHSLPQAVVDREPDYLAQLRETVDAIVARAGLREGQWQFAYQSAGHSPEEWLKPDLKDLLPGIRAEGVEAVLVVPVQFLADHLEILYDIDVAAREEAEAAGLKFHRIELMNTSPDFIAALAAVVSRELRRAEQPATAT